MLSCIDSTVGTLRRDAIVIITSTRQDKRMGQGIRSGNQTRVQILTMHQTIKPVNRDIMQFCIVQSESQGQSRTPSDGSASAGCTAVPLDYELIESIIVQQWICTARALATPGEDDKLRSRRSSIDQFFPCSVCTSAGWLPQEQRGEVLSQLSR